MRFSHARLFGMSLILASGCADSSSAGSGGDGGSGGAAGNDCAAVERTCQVLNETECAADEACHWVEGALWRPEIAEDCTQRPCEFLTCRAGCLASPLVEFCIYHPSDPGYCYCLVDRSVPTGWEGLFECKVPSGLCGI